MVLGKALQLLEEARIQPLIHYCFNPISKLLYGISLKNMAKGTL